MRIEPTGPTGRGGEPYGYDPASYHYGFVRRISWGAIFAGVVVALIIQLTLSLLGLGIGLGTINPATEENPLGGVGVGAGIWFGITVLISLFLGGWAAARMAGFPRTSDGVLHGIVIWGLTTLFSFYLFTTTLGMLISGVTGIVGKGLSLIGSGVAAVAPQVSKQILPEGTSVEDIIGKIRQNIQKNVKIKTKGAVTPQEAEQEIRDALQKLVTGGKENVQTNRQALINLLAKYTDMNRAQATKTVDAWTEQYYKVAETAQQAQQSALQITQQAMGALSKAAIWSFVALVIGAIAAALGGALGARTVPTAAPGERPAP